MFNPIVMRIGMFLGRFTAFWGGLALCAVVFAGVGSAQSPIIITDDRGGSVTERVELIASYRLANTHLEIRGGFCLSACTMYLGLKDVCVTPDTVFGFHGPSSAIYGIGLGPEAFEHWSQIMASYYPEPIQHWYLNEGRNRIVGFHEVTGKQLIEMGVYECAAA